MGAEISAEARQYVADNFGHVSEYLLAGNGFRTTGPGPSGEQTAGEWDSIFAELAERGHMRRSNTGRYWWAERKPGPPEVGEAINVRLGDLLPRVDEFAASGGMSRAAAIRELVSCGLVLTASRDEA